MIGRFKKWLLKRKVARTVTRLTRAEALATAQAAIDYHDAAETLDLRILRRGQDGIQWLFQTDPYHGLITVSVADKTGKTFVFDGGVMLQRPPSD